MASATITATTAELLGAQEVTTRTEASTIDAATKCAPSTAEASAAAPAGLVSRDRWRDWLWGFLAVLCLSQFYFVRELVAAFALFVLAFAAIAAVVVAGYMLQKSWELVLTRMATLRHPVLQVSSLPHDTHKPA